MERHSGFSPPEDHDSSMSHYTEGELDGVPAVSTVVRYTRGGQRGGQRTRAVSRIEPYSGTPQPNQSLPQMDSQHHHNYLPNRQLFWQGLLYPKLVKHPK